MATSVPSFINREPSFVMDEIKAQMETMLGRQIQPAQFEQLILQIIAYREVLLLERFNAGMAQMLFQFSNAPILDYIAGLVAVERLPASNAGCIVQYTLVPGHGNVVIPAGSRVGTFDSRFIFQTADDLEIPSGVDSVEVLATAQQAGKEANGYDIGEVNLILDPFAFVSTAFNLTVTGGGADIESDESLRERIKLAPHQYTTAGSRQSYIYHAKSASPAIIDVSVSSPIPGTVFIVPLLLEGNYAQVLQDIYDACSADTVRPLTDTVIVAEPTEIHYDIEVEIVAFEGSNINAVESKIRSDLQQFVSIKSKRLGIDIVRSHISQVCRIPQVYDVKVVLPAWPNNLVVDFDEVPVCDSITVTVTGIENG